MLYFILIKSLNITFVSYAFEKSQLFSLPQISKQRLLKGEKKTLINLTCILYLYDPFKIVTLLGITTPSATPRVSTIQINADNLFISLYILTRNSEQQLYVYILIKHTIHQQYLIFFFMLIKVRKQSKSKKCKYFI